MFAESNYGRGYVVTGLQAGPIYYRSLLSGMTDGHADFTPDPERFTIREVIAHLADWEAIFLERMRRMVAEDEPVMPGYDEGLMAIDREYSKRDWRAEFERFCKERADVTAFVQGLTSEQWARIGIRQEIGPVTVEYIAVLMTMHDAYHAKQIVEWLAAYR